MGRIFPKSEKKKRTKRVKRAAKVDEAPNETLTQLLKSRHEAVRAFKGISKARDPLDFALRTPVKVAKRAANRLRMRKTRVGGTVYPALAAASEVPFTMLLEATIANLVARGGRTLRAKDIHKAIQSNFMFRRLFYGMFADGGNIVADAVLGLVQNTSYGSSLLANQKGVEERRLKRKEAKEAGEIVEEEVSSLSSESDDEEEENAPMSQDESSSSSDEEPEPEPESESEEEKPTSRKHKSKKSSKA